MQYMTLSFTHKNTDIKTREKLSFGGEHELLNVLKVIISHTNINEAIVLSTCNRVEVITSVKECKESLDFILRALSHISGIGKEQLESRADVYDSTGAIHHLFAVCSSLDSLVIGETQIAGQLKNAFNFALKNGFCGPKLNRAMQQCFKCAAAVRSSTDISKNPVSVSSVAVTKAKELVGSLEGVKAIVIGAGEMSELAAKHLISSGAHVVLINRSYDNAAALAEKLGKNTSVKSFSDLRKALNECQLLFSATGASHAIVTDDMVEKREFERYWFDIAVPRDIEVSGFENIHIYAVDDLEEIVAKNLALREEQAKIAYGIVAEMTTDFFKQLQALSVDPIVKEIRNRAKESALSEINKALKKGYIPPELKDNVEKILHQAFNAFLHKPTVNLKNVSEISEADNIIQSLQYFFDIDEEHIKNLTLQKLENSENETDEIF
ncbi:MAG: glutamyl-tRNA reductase [Campylobacteraceae bacterium]|jgi:glutamyl-tRNA reductase|nr:glutamyl-tRNA reductase [Campylobacteraceae bacterium]